ncbi:MAG: Cu(I)-responsive transcriptional regulator, partial [Pseudomonadota bacterium]
ELDERIAALTEMRDTLQQLAGSCHGDDRPDCPILQSLGAVGADCCTAGKK